MQATRVPRAFFKGQSLRVLQTHCQDVSRDSPITFGKNCFMLHWPASFKPTLLTHHGLHLPTGRRKISTAFQRTCGGRTGLRAHQTGHAPALRDRHLPANLPSAHTLFPVRCLSQSEWLTSDQGINISSRLRNIITLHIFRILSRES